MFTVNDLAQRYGLTTNQVRDRLTILENSLEGHIIRGRQNAKLLKDGGLAIFDRLMQLERDGIPSTTAVKLIETECPEAEKTTVNLSSNNNHADELIAEFRAQIHDLRQERDRLLGLLEESQAQVHLMLAPPQKSWWNRIWGPK